MSGPRRVRYLTRPEQDIAAPRGQASSCAIAVIIKSADIFIVIEETGWHRRVDPLVFVVGAVSLLVYALHGFEGYLSRDSGVYSYAGQQAVDGVAPYVSILNRAGPLAHLIPAIGVAVARLGGFDDLLGIRLLFMAISVACVCVMYLVARNLFASSLAGVAAATVLLSFTGFVEYASNGPREKTSMVLFILCMLLAFTKQRWFIAGFSLGLATLVWQPAFFVGVAAMLVELTTVIRPQRLRATGRFLVGGLIPTAVFVAFFALVGALRPFLDGFLLIHVRYTGANPITKNFADKWSSLQQGYGWSLWVLVVGLVALATLTVLAIDQRWRRHDAASLPVAAVGAASVVGLIWTSRDFNGWPDAFVLLPFAAVGIAGLVKEVTERMAFKAAVAVTLTAVVVAVAATVTSAVTGRHEGLKVQKASVAAILDGLPSDATILSIKAPQALVLSGKTNPTRYQMFTNGLDDYIDDTFPGGIAGFSEWIGREEPTILARSGQNPPPWLVGTLESEYQRVGTAPGWVWYVHESVDAETISALQAALEDVIRQGHS